MFFGEEPQTAFTMNVLLQMHRDAWSIQKQIKTNKTDRFSVVHPLTCGTGDLWGTDAVFLLDFRGPMCQDREAMKDLLEDVTCASGRYSSLYSLNGLFSAFTSYNKLYFLSGKCNKVKIIVIIMM